MDEGDSEREEGDGQARVIRYKGYIVTTFQ